jgi:basic membrane lipoprotein Med (substrate-binding protein (PBP1-ABC) superfamily)
MAEGGVDFSKSNTGLMTDDIVSLLEDLKQKIIDDKILVPETP